MRHAGRIGTGNFQDPTPVEVQRMFDLQTAIRDISFSQGLDKLRERWLRPRGDSVYRRMSNSEVKEHVLIDRKPSNLT
jgi:hypothetical protein